MSPVVLGLLLAIPIGLATSTRSEPGLLLATPEEIHPPRILIRAREFAATPGDASGNPLFELRADKDLRKHHLDSIAIHSPRIRGQVNAQLAVARAKIDDARYFEEAVGYLTPAETVAVLNHGPTLERLLEIDTDNSQMAG